MTEVLRFLLLVVLASASVHGSTAELAPTGVLRATFNALNAGDARFDRRTQTIVGPAAEITKELSRRVGAPFEMIGVDGVPAVIDRIKTRHADVGFVPCDASMAKEVDYSQAYAEVRGAGQCMIVARGGHMKLDIVNKLIDEIRANGKLREIVMRRY